MFYFGFISIIKTAHEPVINTSRNMNIHTVACVQVHRMLRRKNIDTVEAFVPFVFQNVSGFSTEMTQHCMSAIEKASNYLLYMPHIKHYHRELLGLLYQYKSNRSIVRNITSILSHFSVGSLRSAMRDAGVLSELLLTYKKSHAICSNIMYIYENVVDLHTKDATAIERARAQLCEDARRTGMYSAILANIRGFNDAEAVPDLYRAHFVLLDTVMDKTVQVDYGAYTAEFDVMMRLSTREYMKEDNLVICMELCCRLGSSGVDDILSRAAKASTAANIKECAIEALMHATGEIEQVRERLVRVDGVNRVLDVADANASHEGITALCVAVLSHIDIVHVYDNPRVPQLVSRVVCSQMEDVFDVYENASYIIMSASRGSYVSTFFESVEHMQVLECLAKACIGRTDETSLRMLECVKACVKYSEIAHYFISRGAIDTLFEIVVNESTPRAHRSMCYSMIESILSENVSWEHVVQNKIIQRLSHLMTCDGERGFQIGCEMICLIYSNTENKHLYDLEGMVEVLSTMREKLCFCEYSDYNKENYMYLVFCVWSYFRNHVVGFLCTHDFIKKVMFCFDARYSSSILLENACSVVRSIIKSHSAHVPQLIAASFFECSLDLLNVGLSGALSYESIKKIKLGAIMQGALFTGPDARREFIRRGGVCNLFMLFERYQTVEARLCVLSILTSLIDTKHAKTATYFETQEQNVKMILLGSKRKQCALSLLNDLTMSQVVANVLEFDVIQQVFHDFNPVAVAHARVANASNAQFVLAVGVFFKRMSRDPAVRWQLSKIDV